MAGFLAGLSKTYGEGSWTLKDTINVGPQMSNIFSKAVVVEGNYGLNICFTRISGGVQYGKLTKTSTLGAGEELDMSSITLTVLERDGEECYKYDGKAL